MSKLNLSKKQIKLIKLIEKCGYLREHEIDKGEYPNSLVNALFDKGCIAKNVGTDKIFSMMA